MCVQELLEQASAALQTAVQEPLHFSSATVLVPRWAVIGRAGSRDPELTSDWSRSWSSCGPGVTVEEGGVAPGTRADIAVVAGAGQPAAHQSQVSRDWRRQVT